MSSSSATPVYQSARLLCPGISQVRILEWVAISFSRGSTWPRDRTCISCTGRWILYHWATWEALPTSLIYSFSSESHTFSPKSFSVFYSFENWIYICLCYAKWLQPCTTLCDPMDCSLPGSSVHGILQARILQWVAMGIKHLLHPLYW